MGQGAGVIHRCLEILCVVGGSTYPFFIFYVYFLPLGMDLCLLG
jgi:hypothetical protein